MTRKDNFPFTFLWWLLPLSVSVFFASFAVYNGVSTGEDGLGATFWCLICNMEDATPVELFAAGITLITCAWYVVLHVAPEFLLPASPRGPPPPDFFDLERSVMGLTIPGEGVTITTDKERGIFFSGAGPDAPIGPLILKALNIAEQVNQEEQKNGSGNSNNYVSGDNSRNEQEHTNRGR